MPAHLFRAYPYSRVFMLRPPAQTHTQTHVRAMATNFNRPRPPPLPPAQQREFEEQIRRANEAPPPASSASPSQAQSPTLSEAEARHPDARAPPPQDFSGDVNPRTGERGGPKTEPVRRWTEEGGDWSFRGRVSDF